MHNPRIILALSLPLREELEQEGRHRPLHCQIQQTSNMSSAITDDNTPDLKVDETPISPIERQNSLEKHLHSRPTPQELKDRNILLNSNAAPYGVL